MKKLLVAAILLIGSVAILGMTIDIQSRVPTARPDRAPESSLIFASGRIEGATPEIESPPAVGGPDYAGIGVGRPNCRRRRRAVATGRPAILSGNGSGQGGTGLGRSPARASPQRRPPSTADRGGGPLPGTRGRVEVRRNHLGANPGVIGAQAVSPQEADNQWMQVATLRSEARGGTGPPGVPRGPSPPR